MDNIQGSRAVPKCLLRIIYRVFCFLQQVKQMVFSLIEWDINFAREPLNKIGVVSCVGTVDKWRSVQEAWWPFSGKYTAFGVH
jgi:hypothetical protein